MYAGDAALVSKQNLYFFFLSLLIAFPIILYVILFGLGVVGATSTVDASTLLPPLLNYGLYFLCFLIGAVWFSDARGSVIPILVLLHLLTFVHGIVYILIATWHVFGQCVAGTIACDNTDIIFYTIGIVNSIIITLGGFLTFVQIALYATAYWKRQRYYSTSPSVYSDLTSDGIKMGGTVVTASVTSSSVPQESDEEEDTVVSVKSADKYINKRRSHKKEKKAKKASKRHPHDVYELK